MMMGGVAKNPGVVKAVEEKLNDKLFICDEPKIVGATGAALYGFESLEKKWWASFKLAHLLFA